MEKLRPSSDKLKALLTNKGVYIVRSGPPTPEHIDFHVEYARFVDAVVVVEGKKSFEVIVALCSLFLCSRLY